EGELGCLLREHWTEKLDNFIDLLLSCDGSRDRASTRAGMRWFAISQADADRLVRMSIRHRVTLATLILGILKLFLYRVSGVDDIAVGVPVMDRRRSEFERLIGLFSNAVAVRTMLPRDMTFLDLLDRARAALVDASRY